MSDFSIVEQVIKSRKQFFFDRQAILHLPIDQSLPIFFKEKFDEIRFMIASGLDHYAIKSLILFMEEITNHLLIAGNIEYNQQYLELLRIYDKEYKYAWQILEIVRKQGLIAEEDYLFCAKYFNNNNSGGEGLRNIEIHNLLAKKIKKFQLSEEVKAQLEDEDDEEQIIEIMKSSPTFVQIGAHDMVTRNIVNEFYSLINYLNRSAPVLKKLINLPNKHDIEIIKQLSRLKTFRITITYTEDVAIQELRSDLQRVDYFSKFELQPRTTEETIQKLQTVIVHTNIEKNMNDILMSLYEVKTSTMYEIEKVGPLVE